MAHRSWKGLTYLMPVSSSTVEIFETRPALAYKADARKVQDHLILRMFARPLT